MTDEDRWNYYVDIDFTETESPIIAGRFFDSEKTALGILVIDGFFTLDRWIKTNCVVHAPRKIVFRAVGNSLYRI